MADFAIELEARGDFLDRQLMRRAKEKKRQKLEELKRDAGVGIIKKLAETKPKN
jgi:hypothetical protein